MEAPYTLKEFNENFDKYLSLAKKLKKAKHTYVKMAIQREMADLAEQNVLIDSGLYIRLKKAAHRKVIAAGLGLEFKETEPFRLLTANII